MSQLGFPPLFVKWIKICILNISFSVICNGSIFGYFISGNGLHQGCSLSPFLFLIIMDILSSLVEQIVEEGSFTPMYSATQAVSHLLFVDDVLIYGKANTPTLGDIHRCLSFLHQTCGLSMNCNKSLIYFTRTTPNIQALCNIVNLQPGAFPFNYLGIPLLHSTLKASNFNPLLDRIYSWLAGWKSKFLSFGGRF